MKRLILFSTPTEANMKQMLDAFFPAEIANKVFAYMPSDGANSPQKYTDRAKEWAEQRGAKFVYINNSLVGDEGLEERKKLLEANILCITGGNTFTLLRNLKRAGLDKAIAEFVQKPEYILGGFSAGALVMTPTIRVCETDSFDENVVGLTDLNALGVVNFEVFPHYEDKWKEQTDEFEQETGAKLRKITDNEIIVIDQYNSRPEGSRTPNS